MPATSYIVLERVDAGPEDVDPYVWRVIGTLVAHSASAAIRAHLNTIKQEGGGEFVAVPARSWKPLSVAVEVVRQLKLTEGSA